MTLSVDNFDLLDPGPQQVWPDLGGGPWRLFVWGVGWAGWRHGLLVLRPEGEPMTLEEAAAHVGRTVLYDDRPGGRVERGVITSVNDHYVFVRYGADLHSKATSPGDLKLEF